MSDIKLPPLPEPLYKYPMKRSGAMLMLTGYTADEMKAYARAAVQANVPDAQAEPLVLERLSISEAKTIVSQHVEGEMTGDDWTIINAVQSAIAAKNGAKLK